MSTFKKRDFAYCLILLLVALFPLFVAAQIVPNSSMPGNTQPVVLQTANGLPQVNIQTPNSAGVSLNNYSQFDVQKNGAVLNNSPVDTQTQLAGWVHGNPLLTGSTANVIVNQVQSSDPSRLNGYIEVAGQSASVVMANPSDISCDGCGFIHADRAVLTTGQPQLNPSSGALENFVVRQGTVNVENMDVRQTPYVDIIARAAKISGTIQADHLDIKTGINTVSAQTGAVQKDAVPADSASTSKPAAAIDVAELGGMYAGHISLLATEEGVGVNNGGRIQTGDSLVLNANGQIQNRGTIATDKALNLQAQSLVNDGTLFGREQTSATTAGSLRNTGQILSGGNISLQANGPKGKLELAKGSQLAAGLEVTERADAPSASSNADASTRRLKPGHSISLTAQKEASVSGTVQVDGTLTAQADELSVAGSTLTAEQTHLQSRQKSLLANDSHISAKTLAIETPDQLHTDLAQIQAEHLQLNAAQIHNSGGKLVQTGTEAFTLNTGTLNNEGGLIASTGSNLSIKTANLNNQRGTLLATGSLSVNASTLNNEHGAIGSEQTATLNANSVLNTAGRIQAGDQLLIQTQGLINNEGQLSAKNALRSNSHGLENRRGQINAGSLSLDTNALTLTNAEGTIQAAEELNIQSGQLDNDAGTLQAGKSLQIDTHGQQFTNTNSGQDKGVVSAGTLKLLTGDLDNRSGFIGATQDANLQTGNLDNSQGTLVSNQALNLTTTELNNQAGQLQSQSALNLDVARNLNNQSGLIRSGAALTVNAAQIANGDTFTGDRADVQDHGIQGAAVSLTAAGLSNRHGSIYGGDGLKLNIARDIDNQKGFITSHGAAQVLDSQNKLTLHNEDGYISAKSNLQVQSATLLGERGTLAGDELTLDMLGDYSNTQSLIGNSSLTLSNSGDLNNQGALASAGKLTLKTRNLNNTSTGQIQSNHTNILASGVVDNEGLINGRSTVVSAAQIHNRGTGRIFGENVALHANDIVNGNAPASADDASENRPAGTIAAHERLDIGAQTLSNQDGALIYSGGDAYFGGGLNTDNHATGTASSIVNNGSIIDIAGSAQIRTDRLDNLNADYRTEIVPTGIRTGKDYEPIPEDGTFKPELHKRYDSDSAVVLYRTKWMLYFEGNEAGLWDFWGRPDALKIGKPYSVAHELAPKGWPSAEIDERQAGIAPSYFVTYPEKEGRQIRSKPVYTLVYAPDDPIWKATGIAAPDSDIPPATIEVCNDTVHDRVCKTQGNPAMKTYLENNPSYDKLDELISHYNDGLHHHHEDVFREYEYTISTEETRVTHSKPGEINIGKNLDLSAGEFTNDKSRMLVGGELAGHVRSVKNINDEEGVHRITETGRHRKHGDDGDYGDWTPYNKKKEESIVPTSASLQIGVTPASRPVDIATVSEQSISVPVSANGIASLRGETRIDSAVSPIIEVPALKTLVNSNEEHNSPADSAGLEHIIRTTTPTLALPTASLFTIHADGNTGPLIETDPAFTQYQNWLSSSYMLEQLGLSNDTTLRRLGDGFYERRLIQQQIARITGQRYLNHYETDEAQYRALMDSGITFARQFNLKPGVALTAEQMARLTSDIVWLVEQTVTLPDGRKQRVLVPQVYAMVRKGDLRGDGAILAADTVKLDLKGDLNNSGTVAGRELVSITAGSIHNISGGRINGRRITLAADKDIHVRGAQIVADTQLDLHAGGDIDISSTVAHTESGTNGDHYEYTGIGRVAGLYVTGQQAGGRKDSTHLHVSAGRDIKLTAAQINNAAQGPDSTTALVAGNDLSLRTLTTKQSAHVVTDERNYVTRASSQEIGTQIHSQGDTYLLAGKDVSMRAVDVTSQHGAVDVEAGHDIRVEAGTARTSAHLHNEESKRVGLARKSSVLDGQVTQETTQASEISGKTVSMKSGHDLKVTASAVVSDDATTLSAGNNLHIEAGTEKRSEHQYTETKKSGIMSGGGVGFTIGSRRQSDTYDMRDALQSKSRSTVGSLNGDVDISAGSKVNIAGTDIVAAGTANVDGATVNIDAGTDELNSKETHRFSQSGVTIAIEAPVINAINNLNSIRKSTSKAKSSRMKALGLLSEGLAATEVVSALQATAETAQQVAAGTATSSNGISVSIMVGASSSKSEREVEQVFHDGSRLQTGGDINIRASGKHDGDVRIAGSDLSSGGTINVAAERNIELGATANTESIRGHNESASGAVGLAVGYENGQLAAGVRLSASGARGKENGDSLIHNNTRLSANSGINLSSGKDTTLKGATVRAPQITANVAGNLALESLQDEETYKSDQKSAGGQVTFGYGASASAQASMAKVKSDFVSVGEQTGLLAGDKGFDVTVGGHTTLNGAVISSTEKAVQSGVNHFTTGSLSLQDINNHAEYHASAVSIGGGYKPNVSHPFSGGAGLGNKSESSSSISLAGISGIAGHTEVRSDDKQTGLKPIFDAQSVQSEVVANAEITKAFGASASKAIGDYAQSRLTEAAALEAQALKSTDPVTRDRLLAQAAQIQNAWGEGGSSRVLAHSVVGGLTGNAAGAAGAAISQLSAPVLSEALSKTSLPKDLRDSLVAVGSTVAGSATGGVIGSGGMAAGAASAYNATLNNFLKHDEVELFAQKLKDCNKDKQCENAILAVAELTSRLHDAELTNCTGEQCSDLVAEYYGGKRAIYSETFKATAEAAEANDDENHKGHLIDSLQNVESTANSLVRNRAYGRVNNTEDGIKAGEELLNRTEKVAGFTAAGRATFGIIGADAVVTAIGDGRLGEVVDAVLHNIASAPAKAVDQLVHGDIFDKIEVVSDIYSDFRGGVGKGIAGKTGKLVVLEKEAANSPKKIVHTAPKAVTGKEALEKLQANNGKSGATPTEKGFINKTQYDQNKIYIDDLTPDERALTQRIAVGEDKYGLLKEQLAESIVRRNGYTVVNGKYGSNNGFDLLAQSPDGSFLAIEAKPTRGNNTIQLGRSGKEQDVNQLDRVWNDTTFERLRNRTQIVEQARSANVHDQISRAVFTVEPGVARPLIIPLNFRKK